MVSSSPEKEHNKRFREKVSKSEPHNRRKECSSSQFSILHLTQNRKYIQMLEKECEHRIIEAIGHIIKFFEHCEVLIQLKKWEKMSLIQWRHSSFDLFVMSVTFVSQGDLQSMYLNDFTEIKKTHQFRILDFNAFLEAYNFLMSNDRFGYFVYDLVFVGPICCMVVFVFMKSSQNAIAETRNHFDENYCTDNSLSDIHQTSTFQNSPMNRACSAKSYICCSDTYEGSDFKPLLPELNPVRVVPTNIPVIKKTNDTIYSQTLVNDDHLMKKRAGNVKRYHRYRDNKMTQKHDFEKEIASTNTELDELKLTLRNMLQEDNVHSKIMYLNRNFPKNNIFAEVWLRYQSEKTRISQKNITRKNSLDNDEIGIAYRRARDELNYYTYNERPNDIRTSTWGSKKSRAKSWSILRKLELDVRKLHCDKEMHLELKNVLENTSKSLDSLFRECFSHMEEVEKERWNKWIDCNIEKI